MSFVLFLQTNATIICSKQSTLLALCERLFDDFWTTATKPTTTMSSQQLSDVYNIYVTTKMTMMRFCRSNARICFRFFFKFLWFFLKVKKFCFSFEAVFVKSFKSLPFCCLFVAFVDIHVQSFTVDPCVKISISLGKKIAKTNEKRQKWTRRSFFVNFVWRKHPVIVFSFLETTSGDSVLGCPIWKWWHTLH